MKLYYTLTVACIALFFSSCQKESMSSATSSTISTASAEMAANFVPGESIQYGALINPPTVTNGVSFQLNIADQLGISCLRARTLIPGKGNGSEPLLNTKYKVLLNFSSDFRGTPLPFVTNLAQYQTDLRSTISKFTVMPVVAVIENEESNLKYYSGSAQEYLKQLEAAIGVMHSYNIKVANGGVTSVGLCYLVYQDYMSRGMTAEAQDFQKRTHLAVKDPVTQGRGAFISTLLQGYASMDLDYVNFHWKGSSPDAKALGEAIAYLKKVTGKAIINNELGQLDKDPNTLLTHIQQCTDNNLAYILWYSPNTNEVSVRGTPLQNNDASLTPNGVTYQGYLAK